jgi:hypothetical protein
MKLRILWALLGLIILGLAAVALAQPAQVLIIRHAEKPREISAVNLTLKGQERAMALVPFFTQTDIPDQKSHNRLNIINISLFSAIFVATNIIDID